MAAPGLAVAEPSPFGNEPQTAPRPATGQASNQEDAEDIARVLQLGEIAGFQHRHTGVRRRGHIDRPNCRHQSKALATQLVSGVATCHAGGQPTQRAWCQPPRDPPSATSGVCQSVRTTKSARATSGSPTARCCSAGTVSSRDEQPTSRRANWFRVRACPIERLQHQNSLHQRHRDFDGRRGHTAAKNDG